MAKVSETAKELEDLIETEASDVGKIRDFWAEHNISTRIMLLVFAFSFIAIVVASFFKVIVPAAVINMVFYSALIAYMTVTLGINGLEKLLEGIAKIKLGETVIKK